VRVAEPRSNRINERASPIVYAIVRTGGRQEKVSVGDVLTVDQLTGEPGSTVELKPLLLVDGDQVTSDSDTLAGSRSPRRSSLRPRAPRSVS